MEFKFIRLDKLNFASPQLRFDLDEKINQLSRSIVSEGIRFPLLVRPLGRGEYAIIDGNRRARALNRLGKPPSFAVPCLVVDVTDEEALKSGAIGNLVRKNLSPLEEFEVVNLLVNSYNMTQEKVANAMGKSQGQISYLLSLSKLPQKVRNAMRRGKIGIGHARVLAKYAENTKLVEDLLKRILDEKISVEDLESIASVASKPKDSLTFAFRPYVEELGDGTRIKFEPRLKSIRIEINLSREGKINELIKVIRKNISKLKKK
jgi:ParB family chromosome partitioning protein